MKLRCVFHRVLGFFLAISASWPGTAVANELTADELVAAMKASVAQIASVEASYQTYCKELTAPGVIVGPDGQGMFSEYKWGYDVKADREYIDGKWARTMDGRISYNEIRVGYDGQTLTCMSVQNNGGLVLGERSDKFAMGTMPSFLWGRDVVMYPTRAVVDVIAGATLFPIEGTPPNLAVLRKTIEVGEEKWHLTVWVDTTHGYLPRRIETIRLPFDIVVQRFEVDDIVEVQPGVWLPTRGRSSQYAVMSPDLQDGKYPNGMTEEELRRLPKEEVLRIIPTLGFWQKQLGLGTLTVVIDPKTIKVNQPIPEAKFVVDFPKGLMVWNELTKAGYQVGRFDDPALAGKGSQPKAEHADQSSSAAQRSPVLSMIWITGAALLGAVTVLLVARRMRR